MFGLALSLYFASQGAGRLFWPVIGNLTRLAIAALAGWLALRWSGQLSYVFLAQSLALVAFGLINAGAVACGAWFGPVMWPWRRGGALKGDRHNERTVSGGLCIHRSGRMRVDAQRVKAFASEFDPQPSTSTTTQRGDPYSVGWRRAAIVGVFTAGAYAPVPAL